jgi:general secretion pathway protein C
MLPEVITMRLDRLFRRHFWLVTVNILSIAAFFHARGLSTLLGSRLSLDAAQLAGLHGPAPAAPDQAGSPDSRDTSAAVVLLRNAFDSITGPIHQDPQASLSLPPSATATTDITDPMDAPACEGVRVVAIAASSDPEWSLASFVPGEALSPVMRRRGGELVGKTVSFIGADRVWLSDGKGLCQAAMWQPPVPPPQKAVAAKPAAGLTSELSQGIRQRSPTEFAIDRSVVEKIVEHQAELFAGSQLVRDADGGGFRISSVKPGSLLALLGVQTGDKLETLNGFDLTVPEQALEAYARLRMAQQLTLTVRRNGRDTNLDYAIQD